MRFLVVGSTAEALLTLTALSKLPGIDELWSYPCHRKGQPEYAITSARISKLAGLEPLPKIDINKVRLRDRWGKELISYSLSDFQVSSLAPSKFLELAPTPHQIDPSLELVRCTQSPKDTICLFSNGSELAVSGLIFADGASSYSGRLAKEQTKPSHYPNGIACWSFTRTDLLDLSSWEIRTALGKTVEQLPIAPGRVCVKLRFKTSVAPRQSVAELSDLFSEFGSDMEAIFEGIKDADIERLIEYSSKPVFSPLPGTLSLGSAAFESPSLESFDWPLRLCSGQIARITEGLSSGSWEPKAWATDFSALAKPLLVNQERLRAFLHYDNALLRPLRDALAKLFLSSVLKNMVKQELGF